MVALKRQFPVGRSPKTKIRWIRELNKENNFNVAALADLQGPKLRVGVMEKKVKLDVDHGRIVEHRGTG